MPKASPMVRAFNAGEFSDLMEGRVDLDRYPASLKEMRDTIAAPQGPAIGRSGTWNLDRGPDDDRSFATLLEFVVSDTDTAVIEVLPDRLRFLVDDELTHYAAVTATLTSAAGEDMVIDAAGHGASVGDQIRLQGFDPEYQLTGRIFSVTAVNGDEITLDVSFPSLAVPSSFTIERIYHVAANYQLSAFRRSLRAVQSVDVVYIVGPGPTRKLSRFGALDWRLEDVEFKDGPYAPINATTTTLTPASTGNAVPVMTSNTAPSGVASGSSNRPEVAGSFSAPVQFQDRNVFYQLDASDFYFAFDNDPDTYWAANAKQAGVISYQPATAFVCDGYVIHAALDNADTSYNSGDFAPSDWTFEGYDGTDWVVIDTQKSYVLYEQNKSVFFEVQNNVAYERYRLNITKLVRNGPIEPRVGRLVLRDASAANIVINASSTTGINNDRGFLSTDVGRLVRLKGSDGTWRAVKISAVNSTTQIQVALNGEPLVDTSAIREWRLGDWSNTTGWPVAGVFADDRLWLVGSIEVPDLIVSSVTGDYEVMSPTDNFGQVLETSAFRIRANSRSLSDARWVAADDRGLIIGLGFEEFTLRAPRDSALTPLPNGFRLRPSTKRGSAPVEPVQVDNQILFVQRGRRIVREHAYVFEADGYRTPSMSQLASHVGQSRFAEMRMAQEPHSIVWCRRDDGTLAGFTYNREENVIGWHQHAIEGLFIQSIAVLPQAGDQQDALYMSGLRTVGRTQFRVIEKLQPFWDFDDQIADAWFVDGGVRYTGEATTTIYGLGIHEGQEVFGLADGFPVEPGVVQNGSVTLPFEATNVLLGRGFESRCVLPRLENGAADGTAQGKTKRINHVVVRVWHSFGGEIGVWNEQQGDYVYEPIDQPGNFDTYEDIDLYTGDIGPIKLSPGYDQNGQLAFRRPKNVPLPFNVAALMPQLNTQDR